MKIGIVGTGNMGRSLGILWAQQGHEVFFGARDTSKAEKAAELAGNQAQIGSNDDAVSFGDVLFYSPGIVPVSRVLQDPAQLTGKIMIDSSNWNIPEGFKFQPITHSIAEQLAEQVPDARIVKAFNTMGMEVLELCPNEIRPHKVSCFVSSDDDSARQTVISLAEDIGFVGVDCGVLHNARLLESTADLIRYLAITNGRWTEVISVNEVPQASVMKLGGREASKLY
jgi:8-hydroxy-5-deazaflavin:NADPH oxidoreductase